MESKVNYTLVGLFVVILTIVAIGVAFWLSAGVDNKKYSPYAVYLSEAVSGLSESSPVKFNGVTVGYVKNIRLNTKNLQEVELLLCIVQGSPITTTTTAALKTQGITGLTYIELSAKTPEAPLLTALEGQKYPVIQSEKSVFTDITDSLQEIFNEQNIQAITEILGNMNVFTQSLADGSEQVSMSLQDIQVVLANTRVASEEFAGLVEDLRETAQEVSGIGKEVNETVRQARYMLLAFQQQALPSTISLLQRLDMVAGNLEILSDELKNEPSMLLRGKVQPMRGPGE